MTDDYNNYVLLGLGAWAAKHGCTADFIGTPGADDFKWLSECPEPPTDLDELKRLGMQAHLEEEKAAFIQAVLDAMEKRLQAIGVVSPYFAALSTVSDEAVSIVKEAESVCAAIQAAKTIDEVKAVAKQSKNIAS